MDLIYATIVNEWQEALKNKKHPFRYFTLATVGFNSTPRLRTVVLRAIDKDLNMMIYTDRRSKKVTHITENTKVSMLFFNVEKQLQVTVKGRASLIKDPMVIKRMWESLPQASKSEYTAEQMPGTEISDPSVIEYLKHDHFFGAVQLYPERIEYLRLGSPRHVRVEFRKNNGSWEGTYIVP